MNISPPRPPSDPTMSATSDHGRPLKDDPQVEAVTVEADVDIEKRPSSPGAHSSMAEDARRAKEASEVILDQAPSAAAETDPQPVPFELHNLFKAQEAATLQARTLLPTTDHTILRLNSIRLQGDAHIRPSFAASFFRPYVDPNASSSPIQRFLHSSAGRLDFPPVAAPTTLTGIIQLTGKISQDLQRLGIYKDITPEIRPAAVPASHGTAVEDVDILLTLTPASRYQLQTSTQISTEDGGVSVRGKIDNVFGGAEKLEGSYERARRTKEAMNFNLTTPILGSPDHAFSLSAYHTLRDKSWYASCTETIRGLRTSLRCNDPGSSSQHDLAWELENRSLALSSPSASTSIRRMAGSHVKSALSHTFLRDTRDDIIAATEGSYLKSITELAPSILGGHTNFVKWEGEFATSRQFATDLVQGTSWSVAARTGVIRALGTGPTAVPFSDRFQLGGPTCIRMFKSNGLGPKHAQDSLGAQAFYSFGASVFTPIPTKSHWPARIQTFVNAGQLGDLSKSTTLTQPSTSAGVGISYHQGPLRAELNLGMPLTVRKTDRLNKYIQLGVGVSFLS